MNQLKKAHNILYITVQFIKLSKGEEHYRQPYTFTTPWFLRRIPIWEEILGPLKGAPNLHYLEIGVYEGRSALWMLEQVLTHPTSRMTCVDTFPEDLQERFMANVRLSGLADKVTVMQGRSQVRLRELPLNSFDIVYVDGSHEAHDVFVDAALSWELLKPGGMLIFDDYLMHNYVEAEYPPKIAIDAFLAAFRRYIEVIYHDHVVIVKKLSNA